MDMSSELVHCLLPLFLVSTLGASVMTVGVVEGLAEAATLISKVFGRQYSMSDPSPFPRRMFGLRSCWSSIDKYGCMWATSGISRSPGRGGRESKRDHQFCFETSIECG